MAGRTVFVCLCTVIQLQYAGEADQRRDGTVLEEWGTGEWGSRWQDERLTSIPHYHLYHQLLSHLISWIISVRLSTLWSHIHLTLVHQNSFQNNSSTFDNIWYFYNEMSIVNFLKYNIQRKPFHIRFKLFFMIGATIFSR